MIGKLLSKLLGVNYLKSPVQKPGGQPKVPREELAWRKVSMRRENGQASHPTDGTDAEAEDKHPNHNSSDRWSNHNLSAAF